MNTPLYIIERWPHGLLVCAPCAGTGIPMNALSEVLPMVPKNTFINSGIAHHFKASGKPEVIVCIVTPHQSDLWEAAIRKSLANLPPEEQWWRGFDVGLSSAAIFARLSEGYYGIAAFEYANANPPRDAADLGRCLRLLKLFPQWRHRLGEVAEEYSQTKWPAIIARWSELEAASKETQNAILQEIHAA